MSLDVYLPLLFTALFGAAAPAVARRLPPALATWLLSTGGVICAAGTTAALGFLGWTLVGQTPDVAARGHWSTAALRHHDPVATPIAVAAIVILALVTLRALATLDRRIRALLAAYRLAAILPAHGGELVVIDDPTPNAYAIPGHPGRVVVSTDLLRSIDAAERRAVLAHERAHLAHHHHAHHTAAHLAAAANPLLYRLPRAITFATERWADEEAAATARRDTVARALSRAATRLPRAGTAPSVILAAAADHVLARVAALRAPAPRPTPWRIVLLVGLVIATAITTLAAARDTEKLFELAMYAYRAGQG